TFEWTGGGTDNLWSNPDNWNKTIVTSGRVVPNDATDIVLLNNNTGADAAQVIDVDSPISLSHIEMSATGNRSFVLSDAGGSLSLSRGSFEIDGASGSQSLTFDVDVAIDSINLQWISASELTFN